MNFHDNGFEILKGIISEPEIRFIKSEVQAEVQANALNSSKQYSSYGIRNAEKKFSTIKALSSSNQLIDLASYFLNANVNLVRVIFFDKSPEHNWSVGWHQDKTICVNTEVDIDGWKAWSIKDGIQHVQPPVEVLNSMMTFRIHLDDVDEHNGCLKVIPGSHKNGILSQEDINTAVENHSSFLCSASAGDALIMRPHLIHCSDKSNFSVKQIYHRRVVHLEFSSYKLPCPLDWA